MSTNLKRIIFVVAAVLLIAQQLAAGTQQAKRPITETDLFEFNWIGDPRISPDGTEVVFSRAAPNKDRTGYDSSIWMVDMGGQKAPIEILTGNVGSARWSPDGQWLVYRRDGQLALYSLTTRTSSTITDIPGGAGNPIWSPDGRQLLFFNSTPDISS
ncbi:MAG TPA: DPP IV N-terminal domain-containing protein, partial [Pyrinomonadaceae bacterium]